MGKKFLNFVIVPLGILSGVAGIWFSSSPSEYPNYICWMLIFLAIPFSGESNHKASP